MLEVSPVCAFRWRFMRATYSMLARTRLPHTHATFAVVRTQIGGHLEYDQQKKRGLILR